MSAEKSYRLATNGVEIGLMQTSQLHAQWSAGLFEEETYYFDDGENDWRPVGKLFEPRVARTSAAASPRVESNSAPSTSTRAVPARQYSMPILAILFHILGGGTIGLGLIAGVIGLNSSVAQAAPGGAIFATLCAVGLFTALGLLLIGAGQLIDYIGRIAHETGRTADLLAARG